MKSLMSVLIIVLLISCKEQPKTSNAELEKTEKTEKNFPENLSKIFEAHGGLASWDKMTNLCFEIEGRGGKETHTTHLKDRRTKIENKKWSIGFNGKDVWLLQNEEDAYKGNARFYHNLMFYFYAMPFILADNGITYSDVEETELDGKKYKGIKIAYGNNIGDSPEDEYILYYDPDTYKMAWLGYTVTYRTNTKSDSWKYIKYSEWTTIKDLVLPKTLTWYNIEDGKPTTKRNDLVFNNIIVSNETLEQSIFSKPENATVVNK